MNISAIDQEQKGAGSPGQSPGRWQPRGPALRLGLLMGAAGLMILATACTAASPRHASASAPRSHRGTAAPSTSPPAPTASRTPDAPSASRYAGPHFTTPQAAMRYLAAAFNRDDTTAMRSVTDPAARTALMAMRPEAVNLELTSCAATHHGDYLCSFRHDYPASMHRAGHGTALFIAAPALNPGWYMFRFLDCG